MNYRHGLISLSAKIVVFVLVFSALAMAGPVSAQTWNPPPAGTPPVCPASNPGCNPPINVSTNEQTKNSILNLGITRLVEDFLVTDFSSLSSSIENSLWSARYFLNIFGNKPVPPQPMGPGLGTVSNRIVKVWDNLAVVATTTTTNLYVSNGVYAQNFYKCTAAGSCSEFTGGPGTLPNGTVTDQNLRWNDTTEQWIVANTLKVPAISIPSGTVENNDREILSGDNWLFILGKKRAANNQRYVQVRDNLNVTGNLTVNGTTTLSGNTYVYKDKFYTCTAAGACSTTTVSGLPSGTANGQTLKWNGTQWLASSLLKNIGEDRVIIGKTDSVDGTKSFAFFAVPSGSDIYQLKGPAVGFGQGVIGGVTLSDNESNPNTKISSIIKGSNALKIFGIGAASDRKIELYDDVNINGELNICTGPGSCSPVTPIANLDVFLPKYKQYNILGNGDGEAAIYNDGTNLKALSIIGNTSAHPGLPAVGNREVKVYDNLTVSGTTTTNNLKVINKFYTQFICSLTGTCIDVNNIAGAGSKWASTTANDGIYYTSGKVGIGTNSPTSGLTVMGTDAPSSQIKVQSTANVFTSLVAANNGGKRMIIGKQGSTNDGGISEGEGHAVISNTDATPIYIYQNATEAGVSTSSKVAMTISPNRNVGIGTLVPTAKLDVVGDIFGTNILGNVISANSVRLGNSTETGLKINGGDPSTGKILVSAAPSASGNSNTVWKLPSEIPGLSGLSLWQKIGATDNIYYAAGNVGIGTSVANYKLDVQGGDVNIAGGTAYVSNRLRFGGASGYGGSMIGWNILGSTFNSNDLYNTNKLDIAGAGNTGSRRINLWDDVKVTRDLEVTRSLTVGAGILATSLNSSGSINTQGTLQAKAIKPYGSSAGTDMVMMSKNVSGDIIWKSIADLKTLLGITGGGTSGTINEGSNGRVALYNTGTTNPDTGTTLDETSLIFVSGKRVYLGDNDPNTKVYIGKQLCESGTSNCKPMSDIINPPSPSRVYCEWNGTPSGTAPGGCTAVKESGKVTNNYILSCPEAYPRVVSGGAWCDSDAASLHVLRESRPISGNAWKVSCMSMTLGHVLNLNILQNSANPDGATLLCEKE